MNDFQEQYNNTIRRIHSSIEVYNGRFLRYPTHIILFVSDVKFLVCNRYDEVRKPVEILGLIIVECVNIAPGDYILFNIKSECLEVTNNEVNNE